MTRKRIGILLFDGVKMLDFAGPAEVFVQTNQTLPAYEVVLVSSDGRPVETSIGGPVGVRCAVADAGRFDTVVIPGSEWMPDQFVTEPVLAAARELVRDARRITSICSGAFLLAHLGVLDGRRAATHWEFAKDLAARFPQIDVDADAIFVRDGNLYTSAGVAAGIDLALALVEEDHGADIARKVAQQLVVYMQRAGGQSQFSAALSVPTPSSPLVSKVTELIWADPAFPYTVESLAAHVRVSSRHLTRLFRTELDSSPAEYVSFVRFAVARGKLEAGHSVTEAAVVSGFGTSEAMRRAFVMRLGISPKKYQQRFRSALHSVG
ncbi:GlxA family transcriptional regulator [Nocardia wallacei]|uniref:GlxA family transcriptional regulator n=1 Tax=Nocardia wallacei TaxID=480035 RepID=UPI002457E88B|nr:GlxA family transcriptional regulator [Nocardia wallacei]